VVIFAATALSIVVSSPARLAMALGEAGGIGAAQRPEQWAIADRQVFSDARCSTSPAKSSMRYTPQQTSR